MYGSQGQEFHMKTVANMRQLANESCENFATRLRQAATLAENDGASVSLPFLIHYFSEGLRNPTITQAISEARALDAARVDDGELPKFTTFEKYLRLAKRREDQQKSQTVTIGAAPVTAATRDSSTPSTPSSASTQEMTFSPPQPAAGQQYYLPGPPLQYAPNGPQYAAYPVTLTSVSQYAPSPHQTFTPTYAPVRTITQPANTARVATPGTNSFAKQMAFYDQAVPSPSQTPAQTRTTDYVARDTSRTQCFNCGERGHQARACPQARDDSAAAQRYTDYCARKNAAIARGEYAQTAAAALPRTAMTQDHSPRPQAADSPVAKPLN
jgi:hypothetical protein